jgi:hypothetical protein
LLKRIIIRRVKAFSKQNLQFQKTNHYSTIDTGNNKPIFQRPWRTPQSYQSTIKTMIDEMLRCGVIRPGSGAWAAPVVLAKKKDGTLRFCTDLN